MNIQSLKIKAQAMKSQLAVLYLAFKHNRTPWHVKAFIFIIISYALSPIDLIPDFIPVLGYLDDIILIPAGIALAIKMIPEEVFKECQENIGKSDSIKIRGIYAGIVILAIWIMLVCVILKNLNINLFIKR